MLKADHHHCPFAQRDHDLRDAVDQMAQNRDSQLEEKGIGAACKKVLLSLKDHWEGLTVFLCVIIVANGIA